MLSMAIILWLDNYSHHMCYRCGEPLQGMGIRNDNYHSDNEHVAMVVVIHNI